MRVYKAVNLRDGLKPVRYFATMTQRRDYIRAERERGVTGIQLVTLDVQPNKVSVVNLLNKQVGDIKI
jgi:hypothetical protein